MALGSILFGRVIVIANDPTSLANFGDRHSPEQIAAEIDRYSSEDAMISNIADVVEEDPQWLSENNVTDSMLEDHWENFDYEDPFETHHLPVIWEEAKSRWQALSEDERTQQMEQARADMRSEYGIMTAEEVDVLIVEQTTDESMIARLAAEEVEYDEDWLQQASVSDAAIEAHWDQHADSDNPKDRFLPAVWDEATKRWNALGDSAKEERRQTRANDLRIENGLDEEANAQAEQALGAIRFFLLFGSAIVSMLMCSSGVLNVSPVP